MRKRRQVHTGERNVSVPAWHAQRAISDRPGRPGLPGEKLPVGNARSFSGPRLNATNVYVFTRHRKQRRFPVSPHLVSVLSVGVFLPRCLCCTQLPIFRDHPLSIRFPAPTARLCGANLDRARASLQRAGYPEQHLSGVCSLLPRGARYPARVSSFVFVPTIFAPYPWNNITNASHIHDKTEQCRR